MHLPPVDTAQSPAEIADALEASAIQRALPDGRTMFHFWAGKPQFDQIVRALRHPANNPDAPQS